MTSEVHSLTDYLTAKECFERAQRLRSAGLAYANARNARLSRTEHDTFAHYQRQAAHLQMEARRKGYS